MALSLKTEKQIKLAMAEADHGVVVLKKNGNHVIVFEANFKPIARFTLRQLVAKRYAKPKTKKATK